MVPRDVDDVHYRLKGARGQERLAGKGVYCLAGFGPGDVQGGDADPAVFGAAWRWVTSWAAWPSQLVSSAAGGQLVGVVVAGPAEGGDKISALPIYFPMSLLIEQLTS